MMGYKKRELDILLAHKFSFFKSGSITTVAALHNQWRHYFIYRTAFL